VPPSLSRPELSDSELVTIARHGDVAALGLLLERHRPALHATAISILGPGPDADDAVQEVMLVALRHIGSVRDPAAVGGWLQTIVRRACLHYRRRLRAEFLTDAPPDVADERPHPDHVIERLELRDWIWTALEQIPEPLRVSAMLRYFGSYDSYQELAAILGVPIGTVRSRLSEAKRKLAEAILASAGRIDQVSRLRARERADQWANAFADIFRRGDCADFIARFERDLVVAWSNRTLARGRQHLAAEIEGDLDAGVRLVVERLMTSDGLLVVEGRFVNPPEAPTHCPPGISLVLFERGDRADHIRLYLAPRAPRVADE
jgi:RNA polymerase sigma-70 factor (ECF subfamily)